jgi:hypothetical protein
MRDFGDPWFHWLPETKNQTRCQADTGNERAPRHLAPDLRALFEGVHGRDGYGGQPLASTRTSDGHNLHSFISLFRGPGASVDTLDPFIMDSRRIVDEWRCDERDQVWRTFRASALEQQGLPVPYNRFDVLGPAATSASADYAAYLRGKADATVDEVAEELMSEAAALAVGAKLDDAGSAQQILRQACTRCHDDRAPAGSARSRFRVDAITPAAAAKARDRLNRSRRSAFVMPPPRATVLTEPARRKLSEHLRSFE